MMHALATFVVRHRFIVMGAWAAALVATALYGSAAFDVLSSDFGAGSRTESGRVAQQLDDLKDTGGEIAIVVDGIDVDDPAVEASVVAGLDEVAGLDGVIDVSHAWNTDSDALRATDGQGALAVITLVGGLSEEDELALAHEIEELAHDLQAPTVLVGGDVLVGEQFAEASERDLLRGEAIALPIAMVVMVVLLGGLVAAGMPLVVALSGVIASLAILVAATTIGDVSIFSLNVVNMLGIGLGIDYGLLMVNRFREERGHGVDVHEAAIRTTETAGTTVLFSALTVAAAMSGLFVFGIPILTSFGLAGLGVVLLCMTSAITLLPAVLASVGGKISPLAETPADTGFFYRLARWVQRYPVAVGLATTALLITLGLPFLTARFENGDARTLPRSSEVRDTALALAERFPARGTDPVTVLATVDAEDAAFIAWFAAVSENPHMVGASIRPGAPAGLQIVDFVPAGTSQGSDARALVDDIRGNPPTFEIQVGGQAAELSDVQSVLVSRLAWAALVVVSATLVLLFLMTGSLLVPLKAVLMNILSLTASFGAMVWIFQDGHLSGLLQFDSVGALDLWMPVLILIFAFGLSMDYEVFLLSRIKEVHDETGDSDTAVAVGLQRSGRIITSAAFLIVIVFTGFAAGEVLAIKQLGVGLAIAVIIDATIVRMLLVPATMKLLGERNWWAPGPLRRFYLRFGLHEAPSSVAPAATGAPVVS